MSKQQTSEPDAALVRRIADEIISAYPRLRLMMGADQLQGRVASFVDQVVNPASEWGLDHGRER